MSEVKKAYDVKDLANRLKGRGLDIAEEAAIIIIEEVSDFIVDSAKLSDSPYDDLLAVIMPVVKKELLKVADKIDGQADQN